MLELTITQAIILLVALALGNGIVLAQILAHPFGIRTVICLAITAFGLWCLKDLVKAIAKAMNDDWWGF